MGAMDDQRMRVCGHPETCQLNANHASWLACSDGLALVARESWQDVLDLSRYGYVVLGVAALLEGSLSRHDSCAVPSLWPVEWYQVTYVQMSLAPVRLPRATCPPGATCMRVTALMRVRYQPVVSEAAPRIYILKQET